MNKRELIEKVARESGLNVNYIEEHGEYAPSSNPFAYAFLGHYIDGMSMNDYIWMMQRKIILELVQEGPCLIVGRCADYILRDRDDCFNVFIFTRFFNSLISVLITNIRTCCMW